MNRTVFFSHDSSIPEINNIIATLRECGATRKWNLEAPGWSGDSNLGKIDEIVQKKLHESSRLVAVLDKPNIHVGYELGFALGLGIPVAMVSLGPPKKLWFNETGKLLSRSIIKQHNIKSLCSTCFEKTDEELYTANRFMKHVDDKDILLLCSSSCALGEQIHLFMEKVLPGWASFPNEIGIDKLSEHLQNIQRVVFIILPAAGCKESPNTIRDRPDDALAAIITGFSSALKIPVTVICHNESRDLLTIPISQTFDSLTSLYKLLHSIDAEAKKGANLITPIARILYDQWRIGYQNWVIRINWPATDDSTESFSDEITIDQLLGTLQDLSSSDVTKTIKKLCNFLTTDSQVEMMVPPRKLSGRRLLDHCSFATKNKLKMSLGATPYHTFPIKQSSLKEIYSGSYPIAIFESDKSLSTKGAKEYFRINEELVDLSNIVCKYILCSNYQISISISFVNDSNRYMVCTAHNTEKQSIGIVSDCPVIYIHEERIVWSGQLHRPPSSEWESHWNCHNVSHDHEFVIVHFHPVDLIQIGLDRSAEDFKVVISKLSTLLGNDILITSADPRNDTSEFCGYLNQACATVTEKQKFGFLLHPSHGIWLIGDYHKKELYELITLFDQNVKSASIQISQSQQEKGI